MIQTEIRPSLYQSQSSPEDQEYEIFLKSLFDSFDLATETPATDQERLKSAYHPVKERARVLKEWETHGFDSPRIRELKADIKQNIITALAESFGVRGAIDHKLIVNGQLRSRFFPHIDIRDIIMKGIYHRQQLNSPDQERELAELIGFTKINDHLVNSQNTSIISLSPPSTSGNYGQKYIDQFTSVTTNGNLKVKHTRTLVDFETDDYKQFALSIDPNYFDGYDPNSKIDAWYLSHPLISFKPIPPDRIVGYDPDKFELIISSDLVDSFANAHVASIFDRSGSWQQMAQTWTYFLRVANEVKRRVDTKEYISINSRISILPPDLLPRVAQIEDLPCGVISEFSFGKKTILENSVAKFGVSDDENYEDGKCESCNSRGKVGRCSHKCYSCEDREHPDVHFTRN